LRVDRVRRREIAGLLVHEPEIDEHAGLDVALAGPFAGLERLRVLGERLVDTTLVGEHEAAHREDLRRCSGEPEASCSDKASSSSARARGRSHRS
jgi:hypothetical protein